MAEGLGFLELIQPARADMTQMTPVINTLPKTEPGFMNKTMDFLGSDSMKGLGTIAGIGTDLWGISNTLKSQKQAKKQWEAENARANEIMAMNREKYDTYKADKTRLNSQYV